MKTLIKRVFLLITSLLVLGRVVYFIGANLVRLDSEKMWTIASEWRKSEGLKPWIKDDKLCQFANDRVNELQTSFDHQGFKNKFDWMNDQFGKDKIISENIGGAFTEKAMLYGGYFIKKGWLESPDHAKALRDDFTYSCIACKNNFCVQLFMK